MDKVFILKQPYPYTTPAWKNTLQTALGIGGFVGLFLVSFQPFGLSETNHPYQTGLILAYGLVTALIIVVYDRMIVRFFPQFYREEHWTVGRAIFENSLIILLIGTGSFFYILQIFTTSGSLMGYLTMLLMTCMVGIFPITFMVFIKYNIKLKRNIKEAEVLEKEIQFLNKKSNAENTQITIPSLYQQDDLVLNQEQLIWISSADNYVEVVFKKPQLKKVLLRNSLAALEEKLFPYGIIRCHRSYLVNLSLIKQQYRISEMATKYRRWEKEDCLQGILVGWGVLLLPPLQLFWFKIGKLNLSLFPGCY